MLDPRLDHRFVFDCRSHQILQHRRNAGKGDPPDEHHRESVQNRQHRRDHEYISKKYADQIPGVPFLFQFNRIVRQPHQQFEKLAVDERHQRIQQIRQHQSDEQRLECVRQHQKPVVQPAGDGAQILDQKIQDIQQDGVEYDKNRVPYKRIVL